MSAKLSTEELEAELARRKKVSEYADRIRMAGESLDERGEIVRGVAISVDTKPVRGVGFEVTVLCVGTADRIVVRGTDELAAVRAAYCAVCSILEIEP